MSNKEDVHVLIVTIYATSFSVLFSQKFFFPILFRINKCTMYLILCNTNFHCLKCEVILLHLDLIYALATSAATLLITLAYKLATLMSKSK